MILANKQHNNNLNHASSTPVVVVDLNGQLTLDLGGQVCQW